MIIILHNISKYDCYVIFMMWLDFVLGDKNIIRSINIVIIILTVNCQLDNNYLSI